MQMHYLAFAEAVLMHGQEKLSAALDQAEESAVINAVAVSIHCPKRSGTAALNSIAPPHSGSGEMD